MSGIACDSPKYDAVMVDGGVPGLDEFDKLVALRKLALPHLGEATHHVRAQGAGRYFITTDPEDRINHPYGHPKAGFPAYDWTEVATGVKAGKYNG